MKKMIVLLAVILTSGLTALSINRNENKAAVNASIVKADFAAKNATNSAPTNNLATAD